MENLDLGLEKREKLKKTAAQRDRHLAKEAKKAEKKAAKEAAKNGGAGVEPPLAVTAPPSRRELDFEGLYGRELEELDLAYRRDLEERDIELDERAS